MKDEVKVSPYVIATGGLSSFMFKESQTIDEVDEMLTLRGLKMLYLKNKDHHKFK
jgi:type III pantothenate kinase